MASSPSLRSPSIRSNMSDDPFNGTPPTSGGSGRGRNRYSSFDTKLFSQINHGSPVPSKRGIDGPLTGDDRIPEDISTLQGFVPDRRSQPSDRNSHGPGYQGNNEVGPELRQRMVDLEREYNDMGQQTPRQPRSPRKISYEMGDSSVDDAVLSGDARMSPSKPQATSRRQRNAPSGRVHDIEFATEISTSLLAQLRHLQGVLAEKEDALKQAHQDNARLQQASDRFDHRLRELDDTEQRYKEQTWQLESQVHDLSYQIKDATMREQRLTQHLNAAKTGRSMAEREYDELRQTHDQLSDEHMTLRKQHDNEISGLQRALASGDSERIVLNKQLEELLEHSQQMERNLQERLRAAEAAREYDMADDGNLDLDRPVTPDGMGPPSPVKATPRLGHLESETLKSSLNHAHRMIQNLKNNIHREKTEKLELKRMLQDARDELEARKADVGGVNPAVVKRRKQEPRDMLKKPARLGAASGAQEEIINDPSWEEYEDSPTRPRAGGKRDLYDLSTDASDAFETANEDNGGTEGLQTADGLGQDSEADLTETEGTQAKRSRMAMAMKRQTSSVESTASDDEDLDLYDLSTPPSNSTGYKGRLNRDLLSEHDSPASFVSHSGQTGHNLAAELDDLDNSSIVEGTPGQRSVVSRGASPETEGIATPIAMRRTSAVPINTKPPMVDSSMMTEPWQPDTQLSKQGELAAAAIAGVASGVPVGALAGTTLMADGSSSLQVPGVDLDKRRSFDPAMAPPPLARSPRSLSPNLNSAEFGASTEFTMAPIISQHTEPVAPVESTPVPAHEQSLTVPTPHPSEGVEPSPVSMNGVSEPVSALATPADERVSSSMVFVNNLLQTPIAGPNTSQVSPQDPKIRDFAVMGPPRSQPNATVNGNETDKVLLSKTTSREHPGRRRLSNTDSDVLEPNLRISRDSVQHGRDFVEPTLQVATPMFEAPQRSVQPVPGSVPTAAEKGKSRAIMMASAGTQTMVSADQIDNLLKERNRKSSAPNGPLPPLPITTPTSSKSANTSANAGRTWSLGSAGRPDAAAFLEQSRRPGSAGSSRSRNASPPPAEMPPLPADHREVIAAAANKGPTGALSMPPPLMPPSAWRPPSAARARTPSGTFAHSPARQAITPKHSSIAGRSEYGTPATRRSSVSSFQSELDERFGLGGPRHYFGGEAFEVGPNTDPRMIQAITQTMIGEFLWKYTRRTGRSGEHSDNRHKRFFWIHPYTRTLYWSNTDPSGPQKGELKAKSVAIEAVRVVSDENTIPKGLHNKSLVVVTPSRSIKFTAPTAQRHETWFNALSYLLLRKDSGNTDDTTATLQQGGIISKSTSSGHGRSDTMTSSSNYTAEDIAEFNPGMYSRSASRNASRRSLGSMAPPSPSKGPSMGTRTGSPQRQVSQAQQPSLAVRQSAAANRRSPMMTNGLAGPSTYASVSQGNINSIAEDRPLSSRGMPVPDQPMSIDSPVKMTHNTDAPNDVDEDGSVKPRPMSMGQQSGPAESTRSGRSSRIGGWRASLFGRGRSKSRGRTENRDESGNYGVQPRQGPYDGAREDVPDVPPVPVGFHPSYMSGVENVRACCDGKHDVGSLDHRHHSPIKGRLQSRSRSRPGSANSRYSQNTFGAGNSVASRY